MTLPDDNPSFEEQLEDALSGAYDIERELGGGGMSRVFVATDKNLGRKIVIKLLSPELTAGVNRERFRREIQVAAQLQHPHIVPLLSAGEHGDIVYYTMPFIDGESLKSAVERGPLPVRDVIRVLYDVVDALGYAHARGVVHRDIKPANILRSGAHALVTDFGVAKALNAAMPTAAMTSTGLAIGTPAYMAPEQLAGDPAADHRIDIYAVGLMAYELLSGQSPFAALAPQAVMAALFTVDPKPLNQIRKDVPRRLSAIIMQCLAKNAADRPPSAEALLNGLDTIATASGEIRTREHKVPVPGIVASTVTATPVKTPSTPFILRPPTPPQPVSATYPIAEPRRSRTGLILGAVAVLVLAALGGFFYTQYGGGKKASVASIGETKTAGAEGTVGTSSVAAKPAATPVIVPIDSMAIAKAIAQRLAQAAATTAKAPGQVATVNSDSLKKAVQKAISDSINRAKAANTAAAQAFAAAPVAPAPAPPAAVPSVVPTEKPRLAIAELRGVSDQPALNSFSRAFTEQLRGSLNGKDAFSLVDQDSVRGAMGRTQTGEEVARILQPEVMLTPTFTASGDSATISIAIRDLRRGSGFAFRVVSMKTMPAYPQYYVGPLVQAVVKQLDILLKEPVPRR